MKLIQKEKEKVIFIEEIDESLANAIRRSVQEIPILAIDEVEIYKNDSVLYDEIIAHRLGLLPLKMEKLELQEECSCKGKGCSRCSIQLKLSVKKPGTIYSSELKGKADVVYDKMPITLLRDGQELELVAFARLGKGVEHAKFTPGLVYYRNVAEIEVKDCNACKKCVEACPFGLIKVDKKLEIKDAWKCDLCEACVERCKNDSNGAIKVSPGKEIIFFIESFGQMEAKEIFIQAAYNLRDNLKKILKA